MKNGRLLIGLIFCFSAIFLSCPDEVRAQADPFYGEKRLVSWLAQRRADFTTAGHSSLPDTWESIFRPASDGSQNMPGAGSVIATNHVFSVAKPDGLTIGMPLNSVYVDQLVGRKEVQFDLRKFQWIGSPAVESVIFYIRADTPFKTVADVIKAKEPPKCGSTGTASSDYILSKVFEETVGAKLDTVQGYPGGSEIDLAVEKGEVVCRAHSTSADFGREPFDTSHKKNFDRHLVQAARKKISAQPTCQRLMKYSISTKCRRAVDTLRRSSWPREILAVP